MRKIFEHTLNIHLGSKPAKQRLCQFNEEKLRVIIAKVGKLLAAYS